MTQTDGPKSSLSGICQTIISHLKAPELGNLEIASEIQQHPQIANEVIRSINSVRYSLDFEIQSVAHAISMMGRTQLQSLLETISRTDESHKTVGAPKFLSTGSNQDKPETSSETVS